jgi:formamidopyrimidine-DNA glycosylase
MSIELPEASIIAGQLQDLVVGKRIAAWEVREAARLQRSGFVNRDLTDLDVLAGRRVAAVVSRGNTVLVRLDRGVNLLLAPEYGGVVLFHAKGAEAACRYHLGLVFDDGAGLTVRLTGMGGIRVALEAQLAEIYVYKRDFLGAADPLDGRKLSEVAFARLLSEQGRMLKPVLVGKDAVVVGLGNAAFQDIAYRAGVHPKRRASGLDASERRALYRAMRAVLAERIRLGGKEGFVDLHGAPGRYRPAVGPGAAGKPCPRCGARFDKVAVGGGPSVFCPGCQPPG